jgi:SAM-dependent methyltransferase
VSRSCTPTSGAEKYAAAARAAAAGSGECCSPAGGTGTVGAPLYAQEAVAGVPESAVNASLGCGVPTAVADLHEGEVVLDLGSGAGTDALISATRVGPTGRVIGIDMTDEMLELARHNACDAGVENVAFRKGHLEHLPLPDASIDVVISNCVVNLSGDKPRVIAEAARALRAGGRFAISDVIADEDMNEAARADMQQCTGCSRGAHAPSVRAGALVGRRDRLAASSFDLLFVNAGVTDRPEDDPRGTIAIMSSGQASVANNERGGFEIYRASRSAITSSCAAPPHVTRTPTERCS